MKKRTGIEQLQIMKKKRKILSSLDKYIILSISIMIAYTIAELVISSISGVTHDALTIALYGAFGGELFLCAMIKRLKLKRGDSEDERQIDE
jgi:uncharacterized membrane protein